jgi:hypothetical protein
MAYFTNRLYSENAQKLAGYLWSYNKATQVVALNAAPQNIQSTGTAAAMVNGVPIAALPAHALLTIANSYPAWAVNTVYALAAEISYQGDCYACVRAHTSSAGADAPPNPAYWQYHGPLARGTILANAQSCWFLVCAKANGNLAVFKAGEVAATGAQTLVVPEFDYETFCPVALILVSAGGAFTFGTTTMAAGVGTITQLTGPLLPHTSKFGSKKTK